MAEASAICRRAVAIAALCAITGCSSVGDLGRPAQSSGPARSYFAPAAPTRFNETDQEREMHDRVWRFLRAPHSAGWFDAGSPRPMKPAEIAAARGSYYQWLTRTAYGSSRVRYASIAEDAGADLGTLQGAFAAICDVVEVDRQRAIAAAGLGGLEDEMAAGVAARRARNDDDIGRFTAALRLHFDAYSYALDHLLVETPHEEAVKVDAVLGQLEVYVAQAERQRFCEGRPTTSARPPIAPRLEMRPVELEPKVGS